jgi:hypothetical protein
MFKLLKACAASLVVVLALASVARAADTEKLLASAEKIAGIWEKELAKGVLLVDNASSGYWRVRKFKLKGAVTFDVKKTDSLVSPYLLILSFSADYFDNDTGPHVNGPYGHGGVRYGYKSAADALKFTKPEDWIERPSPTGYSKRDPIDFQAYYAFQKGKWVLKGGSRLFEPNFMGKTEIPENRWFFSKVLVIPLGG